MFLETEATRLPEPLPIREPVQLTDDALELAEMLVEDVAERAALPHPVFVDSVFSETDRSSGEHRR